MVATNSLANEVSSLARSLLGDSPSAVADPELPQDTMERIDRIGELNETWNRLKLRADLGEQVPLSEYKKLARQYHRSGFDWLPRWLGSIVGETPCQAIQVYRKLPEDIREQTVEVIRQRAPISADNLAGALRISRGTLGHIVKFLKLEGLICKDKNKRYVLGPNAPRKERS
jgi:hypothetical protein